MALAGKKGQNTLPADLFLITDFPQTKKCKIARKSVSFFYRISSLFPQKKLRTLSSCCSIWVCQNWHNS